MASRTLCIFYLYILWSTAAGLQVQVHTGEPPPPAAAEGDFDEDPILDDAGWRSRIAKASRRLATLPGMPSYEDESVNSIAEFAREFDLPFELHDIQTPQGYIFSVQRFPRQGANPVLIWHGLTKSSNELLSRKDEALPIQLYKAGYDIWLGNDRGNRYGMRHTNLSVRQPKFWNYSLPDVGRQDLPEVAKLILSVSQRPSFSYIGFCSGATIMAAALSNSHDGFDMQKHVNLNVGLGPMYSLHKMTSWQEKLVDFARKTSLERLLRDLPPFHMAKNRFISSISTMLGAGTEGSSIELLNVLQNCLHKRTGWREFDYGTKRNMIAYGQKEPPFLDYASMTVPTALLFAGADEVEPLRLQTAMTSFLKKSRSPVVFAQTYKSLSHESWFRAFASPESKGGGWKNMTQPYTQDVLTLLEKYGGH